jgi:hypothetical protein
MRAASWTMATTAAKTHDPPANTSINTVYDTGQRARPFHRHTVVKVRGLRQCVHRWAKCQFRHVGLFFRTRAEREVDFPRASGSLRRPPHECMPAWRR